MKGSSDRKGLSSMSVRASETTGTHLAHWPPPQRGKESKPVFMKRAGADHEGRKSAERDRHVCQPKAGDYPEDE